jgi:hypothetical protein
VACGEAGVITGFEGTAFDLSRYVPHRRRVVHPLDLLRRSTPSGGFGVTSPRHDERAAKTPW